MAAPAAPQAPAKGGDKDAPQAAEKKDNKDAPDNLVAAVAEGEKEVSAGFTATMSEARSQLAQIKTEIANVKKRKIANKIPYQRLLFAWTLTYDDAPDLRNGHGC
eukprot:g3099.t1